MTWQPGWAKESGESRTEEYRRWRTEAGFGAVCDVDQVEYLFDEGRPILLIELCVADWGPTERFLEKTVEKVGVDRGQGRFLRWLSSTLGIPWLLLVHVKGELETGGVWVKRMDTGSQWQRLALEVFAAKVQVVYDQARRAA